MRAALPLLLVCFIGCHSPRPPLHAWKIVAHTDAGPAIAAIVSLNLTNETGADLYYDPCDLVLARALTADSWVGVAPGGSRYTCPAGMNMMGPGGQSGWPEDVGPGLGPHRFSLPVRTADGGVSSVLVSNEFVIP